MKNVLLFILVYKACKSIFIIFKNTFIFFDETRENFDIKFNKEKIKIFQAWFSHSYSIKDPTPMAPGLLENKENLCFAFQDIKDTNLELKLLDVAKINNYIPHSTTDEKIYSKNSNSQPIGINLRPVTRTLLLNLKAFERSDSSNFQTNIENSKNEHFTNVLKEKEQSPKKFKKETHILTKESESQKFNGESFNNELPPPLLYCDDDMPVLQPLVPPNDKRPEITKRLSPTEMLEMPTLIPFTLEAPLSYEYNNCNQVTKNLPFLKVHKKGRERKEKGPEVDVIDGVEIFSFISEDELKKYSPKCILPAPEEKKIENIITPTKTKDITQIKGWRTKYFSQMPYADLPNNNKEQISCSLFTNKDSKPSTSFDEASNVETKKERDNSHYSLQPYSNDKSLIQKSIFSSSLLDEFIESESNLDIKFLSMVNPNVKPLKEDSPIFDLGPFCKENKKSHLSATPPKIEEIVLEKNMDSNNFCTLLKEENENNSTQSSPKCENKEETKAMAETSQTYINTQTEINTQSSFTKNESETNNLIETKSPSKKKESLKRKALSDEETMTPKKINDPKLSKCVPSRAERSSTDDSSSTSGLRVVLKLKKDNNGSQDGYRITDFNLGSLPVNSPSEESCPDYGWLYQGMEKPGNLIKRTLWSKSGQDKKHLKKFLEEQNDLANSLNHPLLNKPSSNLSFPVITQEIAFKAITALDNIKKKSGYALKNRAFSKLNKKKCSYSVLSGKAKNLLSNEKHACKVPSKYENSDVLSNFTSTSTENAHFEFEHTYDQPRVDIVIEPGPLEALPMEPPVPIIVSTTSYAEKSLSKITEEHNEQSALSTDASHAHFDDEVEFLGECPVKKTFRGGEVPLIVIDSSDSETDDTLNQNKGLLENCLDTFSPLIPEVKNLKSITEIISKVHQHVLSLQSSCEAADKTIQNLSDKRLELYTKYTKLVESLPPNEKKKEQISMFNKLLSINKETFADAPYPISPSDDDLIKIKTENEEPTLPLNAPQPSSSEFSFNNPRVTIIGSSVSSSTPSIVQPSLAQTQVRQTVGSPPSGALLQDNVRLPSGIVNPHITRSSSSPPCIVENALSPPTLHIPENVDSFKNIYPILAPKVCLSGQDKEKIVIQRNNSQTLRPLCNTAANIVHLQSSKKNHPSPSSVTSAPLKVVPLTSNSRINSGITSPLAKEQPLNPTHPNLKFKIADRQVANLTRIGSSLAGESLMPKISSETSVLSNFISPPPQSASPKHIIASPNNFQAASNMANKVFGSFKVTKCKLKTGKMVFLLSPKDFAKTFLKETSENVHSFEQGLKETVHFSSVEKETLQTTELPPLPSSLEEDTSLWYSGDGEPCIVTRIASEDEDNT